jgi:hypothetical protein
MAAWCANRPDASWVLNATSLFEDAQHVADSLAANQVLAHARLHAALSSGRPVAATFLGGSVVLGMGCGEGDVTGTRCAYPHRFEQWMRTCEGHSNFTVTNGATGGTTTISVLPQLPEYMPEADLDQAVGTESSWPEQLLVIDFSTNDSVLRTGLDAASQARSPLVAATEVMLRWLLFERPRVALLLLESDCVSPAHGLYIGTHEAHQRVARHYGVPFLSFASGFRQNVTCSRSPPVWTRTLRGHHPGYQSHQHVADLLAVWLPRLFEMAAGRVATIGHGKQRFSQTRGWGNLPAMPQAITSAELRAQSEICTQPVTTHAAKDARHPSHGPCCCAGGDVGY